MIELAGTPSDDVPGVLAAGRGNISTVYMSYSERHPDGLDAEYIEWHSVDHRPEQHRLSGIRASLRLVSTPECRRSRAASDGPFDAVDHVMSYFFTDGGQAIDGFIELIAALREADRIPTLPPSVERGIYSPVAAAAATRVKIGSDVLPWWPARGVYLLLEEGGSPPMDLINLPGVAGAWWMEEQADARFGDTSVTAPRHLTYLWLDGDPAHTGEGLHRALEARWARGGVTPLLAAPFHPIVSNEWGRYLP
jgi:hypothetical protein